MPTSSRQNNFILKVKVIPKSRESALRGFENGLLKIALKAVPEKGAANDELIRFLSKLLKISAQRIFLKSGSTSRVKTLLIENLSEEEFHLKLDEKNF